MVTTSTQFAYDWEVCARLVYATFRHSLDDDIHLIRTTVLFRGVHVDGLGFARHVYAFAPTLNVGSATPGKPAEPAHNFTRMRLAVLSSRWIFSS